MIKKSKLLIILVIICLLAGAVGYSYPTVKRYYNGYKFIVMLAKDKARKAAKKAELKALCGDATGQELIECKYPAPKIGAWKAVYNEEIAKEYNLPPENIKKDMPEGVAYMEMDVQPYGDRGGVACLVNMLIKKEDDYDWSSFETFKEQSLWSKEFNGRRKLSHLLDLSEYKDKLRYIRNSYNSASRDYFYRKKGFSTTIWAFYASNVLDEYDYLTANVGCRNISTHEEYFPGGFSILDRQHGSVDSYNFMHIPHELVSAIFKDVPIGGE